MNKITKMKLCVWWFHRGQKYGELPYTFHLNQCFDRLLGLHCVDVDLLCAMLGHDLFEDTKCYYAFVEKHFGYRVAELIKGMTKSQGADYTKYVKSITKRTEYRKDVMILKMIDNICNHTNSYMTRDRRRMTKYEGSLGILRETCDMLLHTKSISEMDALHQLIASMAVPTIEE
jgi:(p)ppGpp synthase/HD superfamily hydrolase